MKQQEIVFRIADLLLKAGAQLKEDFIWVEVGFYTNGGNAFGLSFTKRLFDISLAIRDEQLLYALKPGRTLRYVRPFPYWAEADLDHDTYPTRFWDSLYRMLRALREVLFRETVNLETTFALLAEVRKRHQQHPTRETLLLKRQLEQFMDSEFQRSRSKRQQQHRKLGPLYRQMLDLAAKAPHSLNVLHGLTPNVKLQKLGSNYWMLEATYQGQVYFGWGTDPIGAAAEALLQIKHAEQLTAA